MSNARAKPVSVVEAARLIYQTRAPDERQLRRVYERMKSGALQVHDYGGEPMQWTTTEQSLAEFLASRMIKKNPTCAGGAVARGVRPRSTHERLETKRLNHVYRGMWRDYFLAVMLRRRVSNRSAAFRRAVIAGQAAILLGIVVLCATTVRIAFEPMVPERAAIGQWIEANTDWHKVTRWHPTDVAPDGNGLAVEVEYQYKIDSPRKIHTRRTFRVEGDDVSELPID